MLALWQKWRKPKLEKQVEFVLFWREKRRPGAKRFITRGAEIWSCAMTAAMTGMDLLRGRFGWHEFFIALLLYTVGGFIVSSLEWRESERRYQRLMKDNEVRQRLRANQATANLAP
jgi:hypothetical protein